MTMMLALLTTACRKLPRQGDLYWNVFRSNYYENRYLVFITLKTIIESRTDRHKEVIDNLTMKEF